MLLLTFLKTRRRKLALISGGLVCIASAVGLQSLAGCAIASPFRGPGYERGRGVTMPGTGETVTVGITHAVLDGKTRAAFDDYTNRTIASLPKNDGFIGHSARTRLFGNEVWTMTAWRNEAALEAFSVSPTHLAAIREGLSAVNQAQFLRMQVPKDQVPPSWDDVLARLKDVPVIDYAANRGNRKQGS